MHDGEGWHTVFRVDVSFDAGIVVSGSEDTTVRVCRGQNRAVGRGRTRPVVGIALLKGDETFVPGSSDSTLRVRHLECTCLRVGEMGRVVLSLALSPCKTTVAAGQHEGSVALFSTETWAKGAGGEGAPRTGSTVLPSTGDTSRRGPMTGRPRSWTPTQGA